MNIIYILTTLSIYILFILIHKTEKRQNLIKWLAISSVLTLCYNIFICLVITFVGGLCTLQNLSICNTIMAVLLLAILVKNKKIQRYKVEKFDVIYSILLLMLVIFIGYKQYGFPLGIKYKTTDASSHYYFAEQFYEKSTLLYKGQTDEFLGVANSDFRLPGAYVNEGILFKIFNGKILNTKLFVIFDLFIIYLSGILCYYVLKTYAKESKKKQILAVIFSMMYMLGYQLNSMLYGYVYLTFALSIVIAFILLIENYEKEQIPYSIALPILALLSFGIFFSYAYFIPIIYISIIVNTIIKSIKNKEKIISEKNIIEIMLLIVNPLILGATYFIVLPLTKGMKTEISTIIVDGAIYKNYITNLLAFLPIIILNIILLIKSKYKEEKKFSFSEILFILSILFAVILFIGNKLGKVSDYYFFKAYYIIWPVAIITTYIAICNIFKCENKILKNGVQIYTYIYIATVIISTLILKTNLGINHIFYFNNHLIAEIECILENGELQLLEKVKEPIEDYQIYILTPKNQGRMKWMSVLNKNEHLYFEQMMNSKVTIEKWLLQYEKKYYLALYKDYEKIGTEKVELDENSKEYIIVHNDEYGFILQRIDSLT